MSLHQPTTLFLPLPSIFDSIVETLASSCRACTLYPWSGLGVALTWTGTSTQALPMLLKYLKTITDFLDSPDATKHISITKWLYFKAFTMTAFTLWTRLGQCMYSWIHYTNCAFRNDELINLRIKDVRHCILPAGIPFLEFQLVFRKTNKDPTNGISEFFEQG